MEANIVFPLLLTTLGIVFGMCLRLSIAIGQLKAHRYLKPLKTFEHATPAICLQQLSVLRFISMRQSFLLSHTALLLPATI